MRNAILSIVTLVALAMTAGSADARPRHWLRSYYGGARYYSPRFVYPGASYYSGYYPGYYGNYYRPRGFSLSWSPGYGLRFGSGYGGYGGYAGYGSIYSPWYGSSYYRGWRW